MDKKNYEIKRQRFRNVAGRRVQKILDDIDSLSKCSNRNNYEFDSNDVNKMMKAIKEKVKILEAAFTSNTSTTKNTFEF